MGMWVMRVLGVDEKSTSSVKKGGGRGSPNSGVKKLGITPMSHKFSRRPAPAWLRPVVAPIF